MVKAQSLSKLADDLAFLERGKKQINIAQICELLGALGRHVRALPEAQADAVLDAMRERAGRNRPASAGQQT